MDCVYGVAVSNRVIQANKKVIIFYVISGIIVFVNYKKKKGLCKKIVNL